MKTGKTVCDKRERIQNIYRLKMMKKKHINRKMNIRKRTVGAAVSVLSALALTFATPMSVLAEPTDDAAIEQQKKEQEQKEKAIKEEIAQNQQQLDNINSQVGSLQNQQNAVNGQISALNEQIAGLMGNINILEGDIATTKAAIEDARVELEAAIERENEQYDATKTRIKCMYEQGDTNYVTLLILSSSLSEFLSNAEYIEKVYQYDQNLLNEYQETKKQVQALKEELEEQEQELEEEEQDLLSQKAELDGKVSNLRAISADYESQIAAAKQQANAYAEKIRQQNAQVKQIEAKKAELNAQSKKTTTAQTPASSGGSGGTGGTAIMTGTIVSAGPNAKFHGPQYQIDIGVITSAPGSERGKEVCMYAIQFLGNPYVHAGRSLITGTDCSGFTSLVYAHFGVNISPGSTYQSTQGRSVSYSEAQPGDVIVYPGHVALYLGNGKVIHASSSATGIKISNVNYRNFTDIRRML
jgi:Cell wall-associated hydrolases (invasion-associated proteins)